MLHADRLGDRAIERDGLFWTDRMGDLAGARNGAMTSPGRIGLLEDRLRRQNQADRNGAASFGAAACPAPRMHHFDPTRARRARIE
jgi:hypothetical protein